MAICLAIGWTYARDVVGPRVLDPTDVSWLVGDPATSFLGWAFYRQQPNLTFPLGWSDAVGYPLGAPVAYFDSVPLVATIGWMAGDLLPKDFQYLGLYFIVCAALQFYFGVRISYFLCRGDRLAAVLGGLFFLFAPAFTWRALGHFAIASHWILLAALEQLLLATERPSRGRIARIGLLCLVAGAVNPYIAAMTLLLCCAAYVRPALLHVASLHRTALGFGVAVGMTGLSLVLFGFVGTTDVTQYMGPGYGMFSMNLLAPIDPQGDSLLLERQSTIIGQYEGYNYLGLGIILLGVAAIARRPFVLGRMFRLSMVPVLAVCIISLLLAMSNRGTFGLHILYDVKLPFPLMVALSSFRASGRLFWPGYYLIVAGIVFSASVAFRGRSLAPALAAALLTQVIDVAPLRSAIRAHWTAASALAMPSNPAWHLLGDRQKNLVVLPAWQCSPDTPGGTGGYAIFGRLALEQQMTINSYYAGRYSDSQLTFFCSKQLADILEHGLRSDTAYVFPRSKSNLVAGLDFGSAYCRFVDDNYILCSAEPWRSGIDPSIRQAVASLNSGDVVEFGKPGPNADGIIGWGWSGAEPWGRWIDGNSASLVFRVQQRDRDTRVELLSRAFLMPQHPVQHVEVLANGIPIARQVFQRPGELIFSFDVPRIGVGSDGFVQLVFRCSDAISPASLKISADPRNLSMGVSRLSISY